METERVKCGACRRTMTPALQGSNRVACSTAAPSISHFPASPHHITARSHWVGTFSPLPYFIYSTSFQKSLSITINLQHNTMPSTELQKQASGLRKSHAKSAAPAIAASRPSAYEIMAARIANRVAEMAESMTFVERPVKYVEPFLSRLRASFPIPLSSTP